jgi:hypothetical protein
MSAPVLVATYNQSMMAGLSVIERQTFAVQLSAALGKMPSRAVLSDVVRLLRSERAVSEAIRVLEPRLCWAIVESSGWMRLLEALRTDPVAANDARWLLNVLAPYVKAAATQPQSAPNAETVHP